MVSLRRNAATPQSRSCWRPLVTHLCFFALGCFLTREFMTMPVVETSSQQQEENNAGTTAASFSSLAFQDSLGFFEGISNDIWVRQREIARNRKTTANPDQPLKGRDTPRAWFQMNWEPDLACPAEELIGNMGDGHKWVCDPYRVEQMSRQRIAKGGPPCLVYSIGSRGVYDFETDVQKYMPSCEIHTFDFDDYKSRIPSSLNISYHVWGLKPSYQTDQLKASKGFAPKYSGKIWETSTKVFKTMEETVRDLGHENRPIDIFKIDCDGCEYYSYKDWVNPRLDIRQMQIEVHHTPPMVHEFFQAIHDGNFAMFHKEPNIQWANGDCVEFSFLKMSSSFFDKKD